MNIILCDIMLKKATRSHYSLMQKWQLHWPGI